MNLFLFANFFPYKKSEPFLINESQFAFKNSSTVSVFTLYGRSSEAVAGIEGFTKFKPVFENAADKRAIFLKGTFNLAPFHFHLKELFSRGILFSPKKLYWFFISVLITRTVLSSHSYKEMVQKINASSDPVLYFYWGDNLAWIIPYLKEQVSSKIKFVMRLHGSDLYENLKADYAPLRTDIFSNMDAVYTVSENGRAYLTKKYPAFSGKLAVARLGVFDHGIGPQPSGEMTIVSVSNLIPLKRVQLILEAVLQLEIKVTWHHFGDGPLLNELKEKSSASAQGQNIKLHGFVPNDELIQFYKNNPVDLFINVSTTEGVPVSIMEALSFGIPVLATDVGGTSELVDKEVGGLLSPQLDSKLLAEEMAHFLRLPKEELGKFRMNARKRFEEKASADKNYNDFYQQLQDRSPLVRY